MGNGELGVSVQEDNTSTKIIISGELDIFTSKIFESKVKSVFENEKKEYILDCSDLTYIDSTGLGIFVSLLKKTQDKQKKVKVKNLNKNVYKLFLITGLDKIFDIEKEG